MDQTVSSWTKEELSRVEYLSAGLSKEEILAIFYKTEDELSQADLDMFDRAFKKGRAEAKSQAVQSLFRQMDGREGVKGALSYLVRFGDDWPTVTEEGTKDGEKTFKIVLPAR